MQNKTDNTPGTHFEILCSAANMPSSCWGRYRNVALLEVKDGYTATRIDDRPHWVVDIVEYWGRLNVGKTERCAYQKAYAAARRLKARLESERCPNACGGGI